MQKGFSLLNGVGAVDMARIRAKSHRDYASSGIHELDRVSSRAASFSDKLNADYFHDESSMCGMAPTAWLRPDPCDQSKAIEAP